MSSDEPEPRERAGEEVATKDSAKSSDADKGKKGRRKTNPLQAMPYGSWLDLTQLEEKHTYFNNTRRHTTYSEYERLFHLKQGYEKKLHRDDRAIKLGLDVNAEERGRQVPVLSSSVYGVRPKLEEQCRDHVIIESVNKGFYRCRGTNIPSSSQGV